MNDFLQFKRMITPVFIKLLSWLGVIACIAAGVMTFKQNKLEALGLIFLGPIIVRIYCELMIVMFTINDTLTDIKNSLQKK